MSIGRRSFLGRPGAGFASIPSPGNTIDFGDVVENTPLSKQLIVMETGFSSLVVNDVLIGGMNADRFSVTPTSLTIEDGGNPKDLTITCTPTTVGALSATLTVTHNAPDSPAVYTLNCRGIKPFDHPSANYISGNSQCEGLSGT